MKSSVPAHRADAVESDPTTAGESSLSDYPYGSKRHPGRGRLSDGIGPVDSVARVEGQSPQCVQADEGEQQRAPSRVLVGASAPSQDRAKGATRLLAVRA